MTKQNIKSKQGFTIIEVVLVLAIAGLIFLMVFIALPALQRSQRDTQRRQDYANLTAAIENYMANNNGNLPRAGVTLSPSTYINADGADPNGTTYTIRIVNATNRQVVTAGDCGGVEPGAAVVCIVTSATCQVDAIGNTVPTGVGQSKRFAVWGSMETGTYCQDNGSDSDTNSGE